ncbi:YolD-like family protein [Bacillus sp. AK031]
MGVKLTVWDDGFSNDITGLVHYVDPMTHELQIKVKPGEFEQVIFDSVVRSQSFELSSHYALSQPYLGWHAFI